MIPDVNIKDYLLHLGHKPVRDGGKYSFYISPLRPENQASFVVRNTDLRWSDPGYKNTIPERQGKKWGSVIDLVRELNKCDYSRALRILEDSDIKEGENTLYIEDKPSMEIMSDDILFNSYLLSYIRIRKVDLNIAKKYCREIGVRFPNSKKDPDKVYKYIGFKTDKGSWELRSSGMKISSSPKYFTKIEGDPKIIYLFEGFFDYLSALTYYGDRFKATVIILNSLVNVTYVSNILKEADMVYSFLDNDSSANECITDLVKEGVRLRNVSGELFPNFNDFNDFLCNKIK